MRWTPGGRSSNIEDRRASGGGIRMAGMGIGGVVLLVLSLLFGGNLLDDGGGGAPVTATEQGAVQESPEEAQLVEFVSFVLDDAQNTWRQILPQAGVEYRDAKLVLFRDYVQSACGVGQSAMGPFYCPLDERVYIDLGFYDELRRRFGAPGDFAQAYVLAHEIGHHVQHVLGTDARVRQMQESRPGVANELSVRMELQADCYAGIWGNTTDQRRLLEAGDVDEGLQAAAAVGDDRIQQSTQGGVNPESFTHGSSAQRMEWFRRGFTSGDPDACDTFR
ncbi:MAG TPA: neutral zinc metallopeptidase [Gemmatimonadaceae bacterium]|nr:neutral zinc metallopeptidase [Gemmatimonadaceae bacterium]